MSKPLGLMTVEDVCTLLASLNLKKHIATFSENGVDGLMLGKLVADKTAMAELGLTSLDQIKLTTGVERLSPEHKGPAPPR